MKKIYLIRHAESEANAAVDLDNPTYYYDARITKRGESQALKAKNVLENIHFDTYICSPLTRTLQTFSIIFPDNKPIIEPLIREHLFHSCDVGRQPSSLKKDFTSFDFSNLNDFWWNNNKPINEKKIVKENFNDIKNRLDKFKLWLNKSNSNTIAVVSHGTFLSQITGYMLENCEHYVWEY
ncbi:phosphoglycerate mutase family protein [Alphaproteobacteria bacterium]|nr:phosphoglycerate mutase family protein [Alphaproteobacteria bacterium]